MKKIIFLDVYKTLLATLGLAIALPLVAAETGQVNYQARLLDSSGRSVNSTVNLTFKIYDAVTGGNLLWSETQPGIVVQNGLYSVILGSQTPIPASVFAQSGVYLELGIDGETMSPRQQITASAYSLVARTVMGSNIYENQASGYLGVGTTNPAVKLDVNGTVQATGIKIPTGASANYVLVSDANGAGTWQSISVVITESDPIFTNWVRVAYAPATNGIWGAISAEAAARINADNALQGNIEASSNALTTAVNNLNASTNTLQVQVTSLQGATGALQGQVTSLQGATNALQAQATLLQGATNALQSQATLLQGATNSLNTRAVKWDNAVLMKEGGGGPLVYSNLYYYQADSNWYKANAVTNTTAKGMLGLALGTSIANDGLLLNGYCTNAWGFAAGSVLYMDTNDGALATSMPTGTNNVVRIVGYAVSDSKIYFNPDRTYIEILGQ